MKASGQFAGLEAVDGQGREQSQITAVRFAADIGAALACQFIA